MPKFAVILSHKLTEQQVFDAISGFGCSEIISPGDDLMEQWKSVSPEESDINVPVTPFIVWLETDTVPGDYIFVSGDYGMTFAVVKWALDNGRIAVYSAGERVYSFNDEGESGIVNIHRFRHVKFRRYILFNR